MTLIHFQTAQVWLDKLEAAISKDAEDPGGCWGGGDSAWSFPHRAG